MKLKKFDDLYESNQDNEESGYLNSNEGKHTKIRVKHLIEYLSQFDPETEVLLDHDGWMSEYTPHEDEVDLITNRGLFDPYRDKLMINN